MAYNNGPRIITDGLILCLDAGNNKSYLGSGTAWRDLSGNNNNGELINGPTFNNENGGSVVFDGTDDYITTPNAILSGSQTFSAWAMATGAPNSPAGIITQHNYASTANFGINYVGSYRLAPSIGYTDGTREFDSKPTNYIITLNRAFQVVLVYNSIENKIYWYINGSLDSTYALTKTPKSTTYSFCLGRWDAGYPAYYFNGRIYSGTVYNSALTPQEILQNFNATRGRFGI